MMDWQRQRLPEDVPTPVAIAVSDFCRRAKSSAPPRLVREALATIDADDDARAMTFAEGEPPAAPLGPFALVDLVRGAPLDEVVERQASGFYDDLRARLRQAPTPADVEADLDAAPSPDDHVAPAPEDDAARSGAAPAPAPRAAESRKKKRRSKASIAQKIAPRRRLAGEARPERAVATAAPASSFLPRRQLPTPRGRYARIDPTRGSVNALLKPDALEMVTALVEQVPHRFALVRSLSQGYLGRAGAELTVHDVENLLTRQGLLERLERKERDALLVAVIDQKGAFGRAARTLGIKPPDFERLLKRLRISREAKEVRDRATRHALAAGNLAARLELLFKTRYLEDLGIEPTFRARLERQLRDLVAEARDEVTSTPALVDLLARRHALPEEPLRRALDALGLLDSPARADDAR